jgi:hypothetical protein
LTMLTLGVGFEASYGARSALLLGSPRHRHLPEPRLVRASVGGHSSERMARRHSVGSHAPRVARPNRVERVPAVDTSRRRAGVGVSPSAKRGQAGSRLQVRAPFGARVLNHEKEPT